MPKIAEILGFLEEISPLALQEPWDNSGLLVGSRGEEVNSIYVALEATLKLVESLPPHSLLITHHPLLFKPLKALLWEEYPANILRALIQKNLSLIALHTNFDQTHLGRYVASEVLGFSGVEMEGCVGYFPLKMSTHELASHLKRALGLERIATVGEERYLERGAIITGSGGSLAPSIKADALLTGDIKYHDAMIAKSLGINLFDIGHYESERFFGEILASVLKKQGYEAIIVDSKNPFHYS
ncbi:Nif3-like dinuclear metal center hexameric protein [Wolinella succinogenes]|uniref:Nif3-like dinuclear metal center hexameric protein n=1 Tax=Wolinella succinogenes TaxID=844 RepID=UPI0024096845|nr:Nif3-like dinuclear metal center hexameric protein [Wolinella succinogenes]